MTKIIKTLIPVITVILLLTGCFGGDDGGEIDPATSGKELYETNDFSIAIPQDWEILKEADFTSNVPKETVVGFRNNIKSDIFTATVNVAISEVEEGISSSDLAKSNKAHAKTSLVSFYEISSKDYELAYGEDTIKGVLAESQGKTSASDPTIKFKQLCVVDGDIGYTVTAAYFPEEDETVVKYIEEMIESFTLK